MRTGKDTGLVVSGVVLIALIVLVSQLMKPGTSSIPLTGKDDSGTALDSFNATLSDMSGGVDAKQAGDQAFAPAQIGTLLLPLAQVKTLDDGRARLDLSSGTIVRVAPSSVFTLESNVPAQDSLSTVLNLDVGKLFVILKGGTLDVNTPSGVASVRGSYMMTSIDPYTHTTIITCLEGSCSARNPAGSVDLRSGQKAFLYFSANGQFTPPILTKMNQADYDMWAINSPESQQLMTSMGISYSLQTGQNNTSQNCPKSRAVGCSDHPGNGK